MTVLEAERIVNEYAAVLERTSTEVLGAPQSALPFPKDVIKEAIKVILVLLRANPENLRGDPTSYIQSLKIGYASLANFIPDEEARMAREANAALVSGDFAHPGWKECGRVLAAADEKTKLWGSLLDEITAFVKDLYQCE
jgi:hypothetical protein